jgi:serine protease Do
MNSGAFDTYLKLLSASGQEVAANDDRAEGDTDSEISVTLPSSGTFKIWANSFEAGSFGAYTLRVEKR